MEFHSMWDNFKAFAEQPFKGGDNMDVYDWFMFVGMLLIIMILWNIILNHLKDAI